MKMRRMGPETTELGFQDLGFPPYILGTLAENLSHFGYSLVLSLTQECVHTHTHTPHTPHTHTHTRQSGLSLVLSLTQERVHTHTHHTHTPHTHTPHTHTHTHQTKQSFPAGSFRFQGQGTDFRGTAKKSCPPDNTHQSSEETLKGVGPQRKPSWIDRGLAGCKKMYQIWKGRGEGDMEKTHKMPAIQRVN